jgi:beta-glucosidase
MPDGRLRVTVAITNTGTRPGAEVVELYVRALASPVDRPDRELKGFAKLPLLPGEKKLATFDLEPGAFSRYDETRRAFVVDAGGYELLVGASSEDIRGKVTVQLDRAQSL